MNTAGRKMAKPNELNNMRSVTLISLQYADCVPAHIRGIEFVYVSFKTNEMENRKVVSQEEWLAARRELLKAEKELTRRSDEVARQRQGLPWVKIDKEYSFDTDEGKASFADLFKGRSQLLVYHFMFGPEYTAGCPAC